MTIQTPTSVNTEMVMQTRGLTKRYGRHIAVDNLSLAIPRGSVYAFLGRNGAGKTTTIRMLLDLLDRTAGEASIFGLDCRRDALKIKERVGIVADGQSMYDWMTVKQIIWFCKGFYPTWDDAFAEEMRVKLELPDKQKVGQLSRGGQAKLALLLAMAHRPELLILDEPTTGLDVVVRRDFLQGVIELIQQEGRTVFFSSHIVHEVERVADWVGIIDHGKLIISAPLEQLKANVKRLVLAFGEPPASAGHTIPGALQTELSGRNLAVTVADYTEETLAAAHALHPVSVRVDDLSLEDIFVAYVGLAEECR